MEDSERRPDVAALTALEVDDWSALLAVALPVVRGLPEPLVDPMVRRVAALPPGRLVSGRSRRDLARVLVREEVWELVLVALPDAAPRPWEDLPTGGGEDRGAGAGDEPSAADVGRLEQQLGHLREREERLAGRVAALRDDVDRLRRERDGAVVRADTAAAAEQAAREELAAARQAVEEAREAAAVVEDRVRREAARTRRRDDAEVAGLREDLRAVRRERDDLRQERDQLQRELAGQRRRVEQASGAGQPSSDVEAAGGRRGRPSRLPEGMTPGTRRAAEWLVAGGCELLVDGYNVTRSHRPDLALAEQRRWLEEAVSALARRRQVSPTIIWDSAHGHATTRRARGGATVRFTDEGVTADDELVLHVQLAVDPERPVVAVTDDAELRTRLAKHGVDLLDSTSFTWLL